MPTQWFLSRDGGATQEGPLPAAEILARLADGRIAGDHLARSEAGPWATVGAQLGVLREVPKPAPPPLPSALPLRAPPPPPLPKRTDPAPRPPRKRRDERQHRKVGTYDPDQFDRCWNGLDAAGLDRRDLIFFACALLKPGTFAQLFGSANPPIDHLAVFPKDVVILTAPPTGDVQARRLPLALLTWAFAPKADVRGFADSARDDLAEAVKLTLTLPTGPETLYLRSGPGTDKLTELLAELAVARAREEFDRGRGVPAEDYLKKVTEGVRARQAADLLRTEIGTLAMVTVDHRQGLPGVAAGVRGRLRLDRRGLEFFDDAGERSASVALEQVRRVLKVQAGEEPAEYVQQVQAQQGANALVSGLAFVDPLIYIGARAVMAGSAGARSGQALGNRLILVVTIDGRETPVIFDVAGTDRAAIVRATTEFQLHLETLLGGRAQPAGPSTPRLGWEPPGIRDRLYALRDAGHLAGEDYGFLMTILSVGTGPQTAHPISRPPTTTGEKAAAIKIEIRPPAAAKANAPNPPAERAPEPARAQPSPRSAPSARETVHGDMDQTSIGTDEQAAEQPTEQILAANEPNELDNLGDGSEMTDVADVGVVNELDLGSETDVGQDWLAADTVADEPPDDLGELDATIEPTLGADFEDANYPSGLDEIQPD